MLDQVSNYVDQIKRYPLLTKIEEQEVVKKAKLGDNSARNKLINSNLLLIVKIANEFNKVLPNTMDLIQEGNVGAIRAFEKFEPKMGYRFSTYLGYWARAMMMRYIFNNSHMLKPGTTKNQKKLFYNLHKEKKRLALLGIDTDTATLAQNLDVDKECVEEMGGRLRDDIYIDAPLYQEDEDAETSKTYADYIQIDSEQQPDNVIEDNDFRRALRRGLVSFANKLNTERQREIFYRRLVAEEPETLQSLGNRFDVSKERIRQLEEEVLEKLKRHLKMLNTDY